MQQHAFEAPKEVLKPGQKRSLFARLMLLGGTISVLPLALWACNSHPLQKPNPLVVGELAQFREVNPIHNVDIVFVVDNSGSMQEEQDNLTDNFDAFMRELNIPGANLHIAAVSTELGAGSATIDNSCAMVGGDRGVFCTGHGVDTCAKCGVDVSRGRFLRTVMPNYPQTPTGLADTFRCMATFGTNGCGFEHSIGALQKSLNAPENMGFIRDDAYLAFVIITDEDDCTAPPDSQMFASNIPGQQNSLRCAVEGHICGGVKQTGEQVSRALDECAAATDGALVPVQQMVDSIIALKKDPNLIIAAGIYGWPLPGLQAAARYEISGGNNRQLRPVCSSQGNGSATPALRVRKFVESFPINSSYSICQDDFSEAMRKIGEKIRIVLGAPCVDAPLVDVKPETPAIDPDCAVSETLPGQAEKPMGRCGAPGTAATGPCWNLIADQTCTASGNKIEIDRRGADLPEGTKQSIRCLTLAAM